MEESSDSAPLLASSEADTQQNSEISRTTIRKLDLRLLAICSFVVLASNIDRSNVSYAAQNLCSTLSINHEEYGATFSLFYVGYSIMNLFGNFFIQKVGATAWIAFLSFVWGCVATSMAFVQNKAYFYIVRFLLGFAEGGVNPALFYYLSLFYPNEHIVGPIVVVMAATSFSKLISAPIAAGLLSLDGVLGFEGWRILFFVEGIVPVLFSSLLYLHLPKSVENASFLKIEEKKWILLEKSKDDHGNVAKRFREQIRIVLSHFHMWMGILSCFFVFGILSVVGAWTVLVIGNMLSIDAVDTSTCASLTDNSVEASLLATIPHLLASLVCFGLRFVKIRNQKRFILIVEIVTGIILFTWTFANEISFVTGFISFTVSTSCLFSVAALLIAINVNHFDSSTKSFALSVILAFSTAGSAFFPVIMGWVVDKYDYGIAMSFLGVVTCLAAAATFFIKETVKKSTDDDQSLEENGVFDI